VRTGRPAPIYTPCEPCASALEACAEVAVQRGLFDIRRTKERTSDDETAGKHSIALHGFNLHAAVAIPADDDVARERVVRYCARPPFALDRFELLPDGRIAYRIKQPRRDATHRILEPIELLARIAALIPPPRHPSVRYHGVLAPSSKLRASIVPRSPPDHSRPAREAEPKTRPDHAKPRLRSAPNAIRDRAPFATHTAAHAERLGLDSFATSRRLEWSKLLRRTFAAEVLECPRRQGRCTIVGAIQDPTESHRFLTALAQLSVPAPAPPARDYDEDQPAAHSPDDVSQAAPDDADELSPPAPDG
jgi:hypothetical protein